MVSNGTPRSAAKHGVAVQLQEKGSVGNVAGGTSHNVFACYPDPRSRRDACYKYYEDGTPVPPLLLFSNGFYPGYSALYT